MRFLSVFSISSFLFCATSIYFISCRETSVQDSNIKSVNNSEVTATEVTESEVTTTPVPIQKWKDLGVKARKLAADTKGNVWFITDNHSVMYGNPTQTGGVKLFQEVLGFAYYVSVAKDDIIYSIGRNYPSPNAGPAGDLFTSKVGQPWKVLCETDKNPSMLRHTYSKGVLQWENYLVRISMTNEILVKNKDNSCYTPLYKPNMPEQKFMSLHDLNDLGLFTVNKNNEVFKLTLTNQTGTNGNNIDVKATIQVFKDDKNQPIAIKDLSSINLGKGTSIPVLVDKNGCTYMQPTPEFMLKDSDVYSGFKQVDDCATKAKNIVGLSNAAVLIIQDVAGAVGDPCKGDESPFCTAPGPLLLLQ